MKVTLCERVAEPLLRLHGKTTPPMATVVLGAVGVGVFSYGLIGGYRDMIWAGIVIAIIGWYGFLLCGCYRLVEAGGASPSNSNTAQ